jgi:predicted GIY-YIG superfamily endonuclease
VKGGVMSDRIIYLIHFGEAYRHARHYIGSTDDLAERLKRHAAGQGARLMEVITAAGISWAVARTWSGDKKLERKLKSRKNAPTLCPFCAGESALRRACNLNRKDQL